MALPIPGIGSLFGGGSQGNSLQLSTTQNPKSGHVTNNIGGITIPPVPPIPGNLPTANSYPGTLIGSNILSNTKMPEMLLIGSVAVLGLALLLHRKKG